ncbi:MAG: hypothetical protein LBL94_10265 [Prevotellaceae bacterium]|nr:hypothetical protein [Prevotellaceae bacterium]
MKKLFYCAAIALMAAACGGGKEDEKNGAPFSMDLFLKIRDSTLYKIGDKDIHIFAYFDNQSMVNGADLGKFIFKDSKYSTTFYFRDSTPNAQSDSTGLIKIPVFAGNILTCGYMRVNYSSGYAIAEELPQSFFLGDTTFLEIKGGKKPNKINPDYFDDYYFMDFNKNKW